MASSADCNSAIMTVEMALRLSGRFRVRCAMSPFNSKRSVVYMARLSVHEWPVGIRRPDMVGHLQELGKPRRFDSWICACFAQGRQYLLGGNIADEVVPREGAATETRECAIEPAAARLI